MQEKENELPRAATTQPATIINRPISSIIPRIGLQRRDGTSIGKPSVQQVPILFLNGEPRLTTRIHILTELDDEPTSTTSPTDKYKLEIGEYQVNHGWFHRLIQLLQNVPINAAKTTESLYRGSRLRTPGSKPKINAWRGIWMKQERIQSTIGVHFRCRKRTFRS